MRTVFTCMWAVVLLVSAIPISARADADAPGDQVVRYVGTTKGSGWGKPCMILQVQMPPDSTQVTRIAVPNENRTGPYDPDHIVAKALEGVQPGDLLIIKTEADRGTTGVVRIGHYDARAGEEEPDSYLFQSANTEGDHPSVTLSRFGQIGMLPVATQRDATGKMVPDPAVVAAAKNFKKGDVVIAQLQFGRPPTLIGLEAYTTPLKGQFIKLTNMVIANQQRPAIEITTEAGVDAIIPLAGVSDRSGKFFVDTDQYRAVAHLRAKTAIQYRTTGTHDQLVLKDIAEAKPKTAGH